MKPYFIFKNINNTDMGIVVNKLPPIFKPARDINKIEVEGRDGYLTQDLGTYRSMIKPTECTIKDLSKIDNICAWLDGAGEVIFSNQSDRKYKATIINQIEFSKILRTYHKFIIEFDCQPHGYALTNNLITLATAGTIYNATTANSEPIIKIYGSGNIDLTINSNVIHLTDITNYVTIDSVLQDCYKDTVLKNGNMLGEFPVLQVGNNAISWIGNVTKIEITPNWRWL